MNTQYKRLGNILLENNLLSQHELDEALRIQMEEKKRLGEVLINKGYVTELDILKVLEKQLNIEYVKISELDITPDIPNLITEKIARRYELIPIKLDGSVLTIAMTDPINFFAREDIGLITGYEIQPVMSLRHEVVNAIDKFYASSVSEELYEELNENYNLDHYSDDIDESSLAEINNAPVVKLLNSILEQAVKLKASDIHIEPFESQIRVRYRVDGDLIEMLTPSKRVHSAIVTRIKIMAKLNIAEKRVPQDGKVEIEVDGRIVDLRISIISTIHGEKVVIRLLDRSSRVHKKDDIGFSEYNISVFDKLLKYPNGIILMTGPTGSGKTTTLYAALMSINEISKNIITIEDPVEYRMRGINQTQINNKAGVTFASGLRSILRQDPDVIMIGEIRDNETAEIAVRAAITGHLVFSTVHTNDTSSTVARLVDMGIEPFLLSSSLIGVIAQRLVKKLCTKCRYEYKANITEAELLGIEVGHALYHSKGCPHCNYTGYLGRTAVHEVLPITKKIRTLVNERKTSDDIKTEAIEEGMITLREDAKRLVLAGITSLDELLRITFKVD
ncbi:type II secretion system protein GspE [Acidaminobacter sp. JC074]|uniref:GspE/PulE family protein n=1 Tax=Acidaminobacter sp. JC074 TaxID=2530199 RepID=UPI001F0E75C5|nr:GspE/PulE family protein [Acidaminobacter sp. JC074]MCH4888549.1 type II secretion system protein GspE [Acidaminobacter sp. JC074]